MPEKNAYTDETLHVALCCDENYTAYATVVMVSALNHTARPDRFCFHLIANQVRPETVRRMQGEIQRLGARLCVYEATNDTFDGLPVHRFGQAVYQRILLGEYLPEAVRRIIYLDSDLIVRDDLGQLWDTDLQGHPLAAVEDLSRSACETIGIARNAYFNSGVLLLDLNQWRAEGIHWQVADYAAEHAHRLHYVDQCSLNAVLHERWLRLHPRWNAQANIYKILKKYSDGSGYTVSELEEATAWPAVVHFTGKKKPWLQHCFHPYKHEFRAILDQLSWAQPHPSRTDIGERIRYWLALRDHAKNATRKRCAERLRATKAKPESVT